MAEVRQIPGGWASFTFLVDDHILRFARNAEVAHAHRREVALLPLVAEHVSFQVPEPDFFGAWGDTSTLMGYPAIRFLAGDWDFEPVLVHGDLAPEHILVDDTGTLVGLIDFEDAALGDPAIDFVGLLAVLGPDRTEELIAEYGGPVDRDRLRCYSWLAPVHDLLHGLATGDRAITEEAVTTLRERLA